MYLRDLVTRDQTDTDLDILLDTPFELSVEDNVVAAFVGRNTRQRFKRIKDSLDCLRDLNSTDKRNILTWDYSPDKKMILAQGLHLLPEGFLPAKDVQAFRTYWATISAAEYEGISDFLNKHPLNSLSKNDLRMILGHWPVLEQYPQLKPVNDKALKHLKSSQRFEQALDIMFQGNNRKRLDEFRDAIGEFDKPAGISEDEYTLLVSDTMHFLSGAYLRVLREFDRLEVER